MSDAELLSLRQAIRQAIAKMDEGDVAEAYVLLVEALHGKMPSCDIDGWRDERREKAA